MMHSVEYGHGDNYSDDSTGDLFSPAHGRRTSMLQETPPSEKRKNDETLPRLQDTSWIGAKVSPINSYDEEDQDEEDFVNVTAKYHKALNESSFIGASETSLLLGNKGRGPQDNNPKWSLHPLWDPQQDPLLMEQKRLVKKSSTYRLGMVVLCSTGFFLAIVGIHDLYLWYISFRRGTEPTYSLAWRLPWLSPSSRTLIRFGAFCPQRMVEQRQYWRIVTSWFISTSIVEWLLTAWAWWSASRLQSLTGLIILPLYIMCALTGQLWMAAFRTEGISGCAGWGTCGVLCAIGVSRPSRRFVLFLSAIAEVILNLLQPSGSVYGAIGASFFGWSFYSVGITATSAQHKNDGSKKHGDINLLAALVVVSLWVVPILYVLLTNGKNNQAE